jgi:hypothetical protein
MLWCEGADAIQPGVTAIAVITRSRAPLLCLPVSACHLWMSVQELRKIKRFLLRQLRVAELASVD